jgi:autophagy-related protein 16
MELREAVGTGGSLAGRCDKCAAMQDELTVNLREKAADKQQLLALGQQVKDLQAGAERAQVELAAAHRSIKEQGVELRQAQEKMRDMEKTLEVSVSECAARAFEIDRMRPELAKLQLENQELVRRLVAHKEQEADKYNEIHSLQEQADRHKRSAELLARATAEQQQKGVADSREDSAAVTQLDGALTFGSKVPAGPRLSVVAHARSEVHALGHNTSGQMMITGSDDRMVKLWDSRNGRCLASLEGAVKAVMAVDFSRDGTLVLGASGDFAIRIWTLQTNRICHTLTGHSAKLYTAGFTPDSRLVYSGGYDRMIKLWDVTKGLATQTFHCKSSCNDTCVTPEAGLVGGTLVSVHLDAGVRLWDLRSGEFAHEVSGLHSQPVTSVMMHPTNDRLVLVNSRDDTLSLIDIRKSASR